MLILRRLNRILCYIPFVWVVCFSVIILVAILKLNKIPVYGIDPDPSALSIDWISLIMMFSIIASTFSIPLNIMMAVALYLEKVQFTKSDKVAFAMPFLSICIFFMIKYILPNLFTWVLD